MEVEPNVLDVWIVERLVNLSHLLADSKLAALFVYEVDKILLLIVVLSFLCVLQGCLERLIEVRINCHRWCPGHVWLHLPNQRDRAANLQVRGKHECAILLLVCDDMLSLTEVGSVALAIETSDDEATSHSSGVLSGNKDERG